MNNPAPNPLIRDTAQWLVDVFRDELPLTDPTAMKQHFMIWLGGFAYINAGQAARPNGHYLLRRASREADRFYRGHIQQSFHSWQDKAFMLATLSNALLVACGCFKRPLSEHDPRDWFTPESLHKGYYAALYTGVTAMIFGAGVPERSYNPASVFYRLQDPLITLN